MYWPYYQAMDDQVRASMNFYSCMYVTVAMYQIFLPNDGQGRYVDEAV